MLGRGRGKRAALVAETALYYPYVCPPDAWLKRNLLLFDSVTTMVPNQWEDVVPDELQALSQLDAWHPTVPSWFGTGSPSDVHEVAFTDEVCVALDRFATNERFRISKEITGGAAPLDREGNALARIHLGKLNRAIESGLIDRRLGVVDSPRGYQMGILVHRDVAGLVLALTAKYVVEYDQRIDEKIVLSTDSEHAHDQLFGPLGGATPDASVLGLLLDGVLPTPGPNVSVLDVVEFRRRHHDELVMCRVSLRQFLSEVSESANPIETVRSWRTRLDRDWGEVSRAAGSYHLDFIVRGSAIAVMIAGAHALAPGATEWLLDGVGVAAGITVMEQRARTQARDRPFSYLFRADAEFA